MHGSGCDAWLLHYKTDEPLTHAAGWLGPLANSSAAEHEAALDRWLDYLRTAGIEAVGYGAVVLRRRSGSSNWVRLDEIPIDRLEPATVHTLRIFEAEDYLAALPDESALLEERFELVDAHRLEQELVCKDGRFEVESQTLVLTEGLAFRAGLDRSTAMLLPHFGRGRRLPTWSPRPQRTSRSKTRTANASPLPRFSSSDGCSSWAFLFGRTRGACSA